MRVTEPVPEPVVKYLYNAQEVDNLIFMCLGRYNNIKRLVWAVKARNSS